MFAFKLFSVDDSRVAMKVGTDGVLLGAWAQGGRRILDVGTGSGLIAMMMAQRFPDADVVGIDIDAEACKQAEDNVAASPFADRIEIVNISLQDYTKRTGNRLFDAVVCNPPFFHNSLKPADGSRMMARHDDQMSFRDLIVCSKGLLRENGTLSLIAPVSMKENIEGEAIITGLTSRNIVLLKTKSKKPVFRFMETFINGFADTHSQSTETLHNDDGKRSEWYQALTKKFYVK